MPDWFWYVVSPLVIGGYFYFQWSQKRKTKSEYDKLARKLGWQYAPTGSSLARKYTGEPFDWGKWDKAEHVFRGTWRNRPLEVFEYSANMKENDRAGDEVTKRRRFQIVSVSLGNKVPDVAIEKRGPIGKISRKLGLRGLETGDAAFDEQYTVTTDDPNFASAMLTGDLRSWLMSDDRSKDNPIRIVDDSVLTWRTGPLELDDIEHRLRFLHDFLAQAPKLPR